VIHTRVIRRSGLASAAATACRPQNRDEKALFVELGAHLRETLHLGSARQQPGGARQIILGRGRVEHYSHSSAPFFQA
jgi:hypothetical protein